MGTKIIGQIAALLWVVLAALVLVFGYYRRDELSRLLSSVKLPGGIELTFRGELDNAISKKAAPDAVSDAARGRVLRRATRDFVSTAGARILWVDDTPEGNLPERKVLRSLGIMIDLARTSQEGISALDRADYDLIISNMSRERHADEGKRFLTEIRTAGRGEPVVFYIMNLDRSRGTPGDAVGITNRPDELVHLVLDGLERVRG
jgi:CheY-like chemotaxis protein